ncbi:hypothetical protein SAMN05428970_3337 [Agromyces sp. CF514]|uniref:hypothetical protein n=1 Tax=Agromyces sp. CF514 TaxID=1881031 RepID=UPI0008E6165F|nr:hypothetical protein [Agromyces sp. CF514]SFR86698.1 hypothetical protein SAMN05428970_3337 [Agromyces sp. CF514]
MRWDLLFDDLEARLDQEQRDEERALALEEERLRLGRLSLRDRLAGIARAIDDGVAGFVRIEVRTGQTLALRPSAFGRDWVTGDHLDGDRTGRHCIVPLDAIAAILAGPTLLERSLEPNGTAASGLTDRMGMAIPLRDLSRRRAAVHVLTEGGRVHGTIDRVARDHLDLAVHPAGTPRREREVQGYRIVPFDRILLVSFGPPA